MTEKRWIRIYGGTLEGLESLAFKYVVKRHQRRVLGVLFSNDAALSLSLSNEMELEMNDFKSNDALVLPPSMRVLDWKQEVTPCDSITGSITNLKSQTRNMNVYLYMEEA